MTTIFYLYGKPLGFCVFLDNSENPNGFRIMNNIATLDKIASVLEARGLSHLAAELDKVSNTLEHPVILFSQLFHGHKWASETITFMNKLHSRKAYIDPNKDDLTANEIIEELQSSVGRISNMSTPALTWAYTIQDLFSRASEKEELTRHMRDLSEVINKDMHSQAKKLLELKKADPKLHTEIVKGLEDMIIKDLATIPLIRDMVAHTFKEFNREVEAASASPEGILESHVKGVVEDLKKDLESVGKAKAEIPEKGIETQSLIGNLYHSLMDLAHYKKSTEQQFIDKYKADLLNSSLVKEGLKLIGNLLKKEEFSDKHRTLTKLMNLIDPQLANLMNSNGLEVPPDQA